MSSPYGQHPYPAPQWQPPAPPPEPKQKWYRRWAPALVFGALVVFGAGVGTAMSDRSVPSTPVVPTTPASATEADRPAAPAKMIVPSVVGMTSTDAATTLATAGFANITFEQNGAPPSAKVVSQAPTAGTLHEGSTEIYLVAELPTPAREISARDWLLIAKSPDSHVGERIVVYGDVTQFDSATGTSTFRANVDAVRHNRTYEYPTNTLLRGTDEALAAVVQGDQFRAEVTVAGTYSYTTTMGGSLTVPVLDVTAIEVIG